MTGVVMVSDYVRVNGYTRYLLTLGIKEDAGLEACHSAYLELLKKWHPDRFPLGHPSREEAEAKTKEITEAFETLRRAKSKQIAGAKTGAFRISVQEKNRLNEKLSRLPIKVERKSNS